MVLENKMDHIDISNIKMYSIAMGSKIVIKRQI